MLDVGDFQLLSKSSKYLHTACARGFSSRREGYKCKNISQNISFIFGLAQSRTKFWNAPTEPIITRRSL